MYATIEIPQFNCRKVLWVKMFSAWLKSSVTNSQKNTKVFQWSAGTQRRVEDGRLVVSATLMQSGSSSLFELLTRTKCLSKVAWSCHLKLEKRQTIWIRIRIKILKHTIDILSFIVFLFFFGLGCVFLVDLVIEFAATDIFGSGDVSFLCWLSFSLRDLRGRFRCWTFEVDCFESRSLLEEVRIFFLLQNVRDLEGVSIKLDKKTF